MPSKRFEFKEKNHTPVGWETNSSKVWHLEYVFGTTLSYRHPLLKDSLPLI